MRSCFCQHGGGSRVIHFRRLIRQNATGFFHCLFGSGFIHIDGGAESGTDLALGEDDEATNTGDRGEEADNGGVGEANGAEEEEDAGGCSVNGPVNSPSRGATLLLMLLGMMAMRRRRA